MTSIHADAEADPREVGMTPEGVSTIWSAIEGLYRSGVHPAIALCLRRRGRVVIDRAIGHAEGNGPHDPAGTPQRLATPATPFCIFSASKAVTAMLIHLLDERDLLRLDDPVCEYIPEFAKRTKQWITIRHLLIHRAGIPSPPPEAMDPALLNDPEEIVRILCDLPQIWRPGRQLAYHAVTGGFVLGEIVRRVTGRDIGRFLADELCERLGWRWMRYGAAPEDVPLIARNYVTGPEALPPLSWMLERALGVPVARVIDLSNDPQFYGGAVPSGNIVSTANELSQFYQLLLDGGVQRGIRIFEPRTVRRAVGEQSYLEIDFTLGLPFRYGMGFMLGGEWVSLYGPDTRYAFGHLGFSNVIAWADPERDVAGALLTSGKPLVYWHVLDLWNLMSGIGRACSKVRTQPWRMAVAAT